jgi:hypothetical protein
MTTVVAVGFMVTSVTLAWFSNKAILSNHDVLDELDRVQQQKEAGAAAPTEGATAPAEAAPGAAPVIDVTPTPDGATPTEGTPEGAPAEAPAAPASPAPATPAPSEPSAPPPSAPPPSGK